MTRSWRKKHGIVAAGALCRSIVSVTAACESAERKCSDGRSTEITRTLPEVDTQAADVIMDLRTVHSILDRGTHAFQHILPAILRAAWSSFRR